MQKKMKKKIKKIFQTVNTCSRVAAKEKEKNKKKQTKVLRFAVSETLALAVVGRNKLELRRGTGEQAEKQRRIPSCRFVI